MRSLRLAAALALASGLAVLLPADPAAAHPLGNFTVNQHSGLTITPGLVTMDLVVDMAEIPAFQTRSEIDTDRDKQVSPAEALAYRQRACTGLQNGTELRLDGQAVPTTVTLSDLTFPPGQAGLVTLRLTCQLTARPGQGSAGRLDFVNHSYSDRIGWREITATGGGVRLLASDVPRDSSSAVLTQYPKDLLSSPLDQRDAHLVVATGAGAPGILAAGTPDSPGAPDRSAAPLARGSDRFTAAFTGLVARQDFTVGFALLALLAAIALGAVHALAPGHGKTVMAAYLVGERGSLRQAALLGLTVTSTHTAGVLVLGLLLSGSTTLVPEQLYPWLGATSGAMLAAVGVSLLVRTWQRRRTGLAPFADHDHHHGPAHHHGHPHGHGPTHGHHTHEPPVSRKALMIMGAAGGMVPSPSALVVLLGAIALGRTWFGIALVLGYGIGMALTLVAAGMLMVRARAALDGRLPGRRFAILVRTIPVMTASFVVIAGIGLAAQAVRQM